MGRNHFGVNIQNLNCNSQLLNFYQACILTLLLGSQRQPPVKRSFCRLNRVIEAWLRCMARWAPLVLLTLPVCVFIMKVSQQVRAVLKKDASLICKGIPYGLFVVPHNEQQVFPTQPTFSSACWIVCVSEMFPAELYSKSWIGQSHSL